MSATKPTMPKKEITWTAQLIKMLRGKRTLAEFGELVGAPKNTVWRWEAGYTKPDGEHSKRLSELAEEECFLDDWRLAGSAEIVGDIEEGSHQAAESFKRAIARSAFEV
jgi:transcriptional regulator with XRE-family HTH domain